MNIKLEPHKDYAKAIQSVKPSGRIVYNYYKLIEVTALAYDLNWQDATEWTDYNILGIACNGFDVSHAQPGAKWKPAPTTASGKAKRKKVK